MGDAFDGFRLADPFIDFDEITAADEQRLATIIATRPSTASNRSPRHLWRWAVVLGIGTTVIASGAYALARSQPAHNPTGITCYQEADLDSSRVVLGPTDDPIATCAAVWMDGTLGRSGPPELAACVNAPGVAVVLPGDQSACGRLGLPDLEAGRGPEEQAIVDLQATLEDVFAANCYRQSQALSKARDLLDASGLEGWQVELAEPFPPASQCGATGVLTDSRTVLVIGAREAP